MKPLLSIAFSIFIFLFSCTQNQTFDGIAVTTSYIDALNESDFDKVTSLFLDSVRMKEGIYANVLSRQGYKDMFQWDSTFRPTYKILEIVQSGDTVLMEVSKTCTRIRFLHGEPTVSKEQVVFKNGKIFSIEIIDFVVFDDEKWSAIRADLLAWIEVNHPELNGFIYDQTKKGAINYLKAIELYSTKEGTAAP